MSKERIVNFRVSADTYDDFKKLCFEMDLNPSDVLRDAVKSFLLSPNEAFNNSGAEDVGDGIIDRLEALEAKLNHVLIDDTPTYQVKKKIPSVKPKKEINPILLERKDLITIEEMEALTGYTRSTLSPKLSKLGIKAVKRLNGNRGGLYDKAEIMRELGTNPNR